MHIAQAGTVCQPLHTKHAPRWSKLRGNYGFGVLRDNRGALGRVVELTGTSSRPARLATVVRCHSDCSCRPGGPQRPCSAATGGGASSLTPLKYDGVEHCSSSRLKHGSDKNWLDCVLMCNYQRCLIFDRKIISAFIWLTTIAKNNIFIFPFKCSAIIRQAEIEIKQKLNVK